MDILDRLLNVRNDTDTLEPVCDKAAEEIMRLRSLTFEMLAALSWLRGNGILDDPHRFDKIEAEAREALRIGLAEATKIPSIEFKTLQQLHAEPLVEVIEVKPRLTIDDHQMPTYKICPHCGDRNTKTVHLRRRPPMLQCNACGVEYKWPHRWM